MLQYEQPFWGGAVVVFQVPPGTSGEVVYPDCDGKPLANNTEHFDLIVLIKENLELLFADRPDVFIAGDLFWYPVEGNADIKMAPDVMVAIGRPKGKRYSYRQWEEGGYPPQVVFEILSPAHTVPEMDRKLLFFDRYGVEEYYIYNPANNELRIWLRNSFGLDWVAHDGEWISERLKIRMVVTGTTLELFDAEGNPFLSPLALAQQAKQERQKAAQAMDTAVGRLLAMGLTHEQVAEALGLSIERVQSVVPD